MVVCVRVISEGIHSAGTNELTVAWVSRRVGWAIETIFLIYYNTYIWAIGYPNMLFGGSIKVNKVCNPAIARGAITLSTVS
jgi:hypothetical protein